MELYLDSVKFDEIRAAADLGILTGLTTTPTFMHREGIKDVDAALVELSKLVGLLHIEALGNSAEEIVAEADRQLALAIDDACTPVFKIPVSNQGIRACKILTDRGMLVNIHLVYTLNQAYMAMNAGAAYICPLVGRLHDQGHDAMALIEDCVEAVNYYGYESKVMVSSVRHPEHVRQAIRRGAHAVTAPWGVLKTLTSNHLTDLGTSQFTEHTRLMTERVRDILTGSNPTVRMADTVQTALLRMTESRMGATAVLDAQGNLAGMFTDGDIRRMLRETGEGILNRQLQDVHTFKAPLTIDANALLFDAVNLFKQHSVDNLAVTEGETLLGMLDIQDLVRQGLMG